MRELKFAIKHTIPIFFTYLFIGIAFGMLMNDSGYGIFWTLLSALFIYAGSMQLVMVPLLSSGASIPTLILMTIFINARHIFYGIGFVERFQKRGILYPYMVFSLTDETYSILCSVEYDEGIDEKWADFFIAFLNHCYWIVGCFIGAYTGRAFGIDTAGIDFSATALFIVVVVDQIRRYRTKLPFFLASTVSLVLIVLIGKDYFIIPSLIISSLLLITLHRKIEKQEGIIYE